jgi:predicted nuclease of restriction endonuclease-like (RecB) superfamily
MKKVVKSDYSFLIDSIGVILEQGRNKVFYAANSILVRTYWEIGKEIVEFEQKGKEKAEYGSALLKKLSKDLKLRYGKGFSISNVYLMRQFYFKYQKFQTVSGELSWSHYVELLGIGDDLARSFYEKQCLNERWSVRELKRQINSALFQRIALSKDKAGVLALSRKGNVIEKAEDVVKDPYVLEFLNLPEDYRYSEKEVEQRIIDNLQLFLLELGKGFTFVKRQFRITLDNTDYYVDLVFYHRVLKCFVLIDLKIGKVTHSDVGQMNVYLNYFKAEESSKGDNEPIGIILAAGKNNLLVKYALGGISNKLFVSKYKLYLPDKKELEKQMSSLLFCL